MKENTIAAVDLLSEQMLEGELIVLLKHRGAVQVGGAEMLDLTTGNYIHSAGYVVLDAMRKTIASIDP